jgi:hypothetical protein
LSVVEKCGLQGQYVVSEGSGAGIVELTEAEAAVMAGEIGDEEEVILIG